jgi:hypothetical protein
VTGEIDFGPSKEEQDPYENPRTKGDSSSSTVCFYQQPMEQVLCLSLE